MAHCQSRAFPPLESPDSRCFVIVHDSKFHFLMVKCRFWTQFRTEIEYNFTDIIFYGSSEKNFLSSKSFENSKLMFKNGNQGR